MRNILKASTLERLFPLMAVENDIIISKNADLTIAFKVELPEIFTISGPEYQTIHSTWIKAIKILPNYTVICKQDWFISDRYKAKEGEGFLSQSFERHFNEREFLNHTCYLFVTKTTREQSRTQSNFSSLCRNFIVPKEVNRETASKFIETVEQFERIINDSGLVALTRLTGEDIVGTEEKAGILQQYFSLSQEDKPVLEDMSLAPRQMKIGDKRLCLFTLSDIEYLPGSVDADARYEKYSTERTDCRLSFASPCALLLSCDHIYTQFLFKDDSDEIINRLEKQAKNMFSLGKYSRANQINREWINLFLNEAHSKGISPVRVHCNIMAWASDEEKLKRMKNEVGSQIALMNCYPHANTVDVPTLYWAGIAGNAGDFPAEESFLTFPEQAVCLWNMETNYKSSPSPFGIKLADRFGNPVHVDISDLPMQKGIIQNRNKFILGGSGSGKSFFTNHLVRQYWEQNSHIVIVDVGNSYEGLCRYVSEVTNGEDGVYFTYTEENPIRFNPFYSEDYSFDIEKKESIKTLVLTLWKKDTEPAKRSEEVALSNGISLYLKKIKKDRSLFPSFDGFYEYMQGEYREVLKETNVREKDFDLDNFLNVLAPFHADGEYGYLLNAKDRLDLLHKRFVVFELDVIKDHAILFSVVTLVIMETFISKMRKLKGIRKVILIEEAWKAISKAGMAEYVKYLYKTVRKHFGEAITITQEVEDIISSEIVKESIINNSDCKILLDQRKYLNKFGPIAELLGLTDREKAQILSVNQSNQPSRKYKEVWISLGGIHSAVYATEVSKVEYYIYTTEEREKMQVMELAGKTGSIRKAVQKLSQSN
jgi:conjugation system TraG family ATPase